MKPEEFQKLMEKMRAPKGTPEGAKPNLVEEISTIIERWAPAVVNAIAGKAVTQSGTEAHITALFQSLTPSQVEALYKILTPEQLDLLMKLAPRK